MTTYRIRSLALLAIAAACGAPDVGRQQQTPAHSVVSAAFDPTTGNIPLPNDLAILSVPTTVPPAQQDLLNAFKAAGGFPNDQEVPVAISFVRTNIATDGTVTNVAPTLDTSTVVPGSTLLVFVNTGQGINTVALDPITDANYVSLGDHGVLTLHNVNKAPWTPVTDVNARPAHYVVALRGGSNGIKTKEGDPIVASSVFYLIATGQDLTADQNLTLLRAQLGSEEAGRAAAAQLNQVVALYKATPQQPIAPGLDGTGAFQGVNQVFPQQELAAMTTFAIEPLKTEVQVDPNRGLAPLPFDLLRDPRPVSSSCAACGKLTPLAACTLARGTLDAQGVCRDSQGNPNPGAAGFAALDGFSTTGMILAPVNTPGGAELVTASTVTPATVQLWELNGTASPVKVNATTYISEPVEVTQQGFSPTIALQPAGATAADATSVFRTRPLKDNTDYAVVISNGVLDKSGKPLGRGTVAKILQVTHPIVDANGKSQLSGVDDQTAGALEIMRLKLAPALAASGFNVAQGQVAMAYTFKTQSITSTAVQIGALPYTKAAATGNTGTINSLTATAAFAKYGVDPNAVPKTNIAEVIETTITTFNLLDPATGAFNAAGITADETINVLIARPVPGTAPACTGALAPFAPLATCSPLIVFRHGLGGGRANMLAAADALNAQGFTVVAIDAAKHGDRSFCTSGQTQINLGGTLVNQCAGGNACTPLLPAGAQGDTNPIGTCAPNAFNYLPVSGACLANPGSCGWTGGEGIPAVSSNYLVTANFFRTRDTLRQDIIDQSQLVRAVAFVPSGPPPTNHNLFDYMFGRGVIIDPGNVSFLGQSLGAIQGTADVAANPRISKAVLNVGGGTVVDVFTTSPAFQATTGALLAQLGVQPGTPQFLQFLVVAKTVLDPADPVNFAGHLQANTLPNLLANPNGSVAQSAKSILTQAAYCDQVVPNPWNFVLDSTAGSSPMLLDPGFGTGTGTFQLFYKFTGAAPDLTTCPAPPSTTNLPANRVTHGFLLDFADATMTGRAQADATAFLMAGTLPNSLVVLP